MLWKRRTDNHTHSREQHSHAHGVIDPSIAASERGIWAIRWSFIGLVATALLQVVVVWFSGSVALLADTIHNFGDAATAIPLGVAFSLARLRPTERFSFGYGRVEDLAGVVIVLVILFSAVVAGYEAIDRLLHPLITVAILGIVWQSAKAVFIRLLDGVEPEVLDEIRHAAQHVPSVQKVTEVRARWVGHRLHTEVNIAVAPELSVAQGHAIAKEVHHHLMHHLGYLSLATVHVDPLEEAGEHHHRVTEHSHDGLPVHSH